MKFNGPETPFYKFAKQLLDVGNRAIVASADRTKQYELRLKQDKKIYMKKQKKIMAQNKIEMKKKLKNDKRKLKLAIKREKLKMKRKKQQASSSEDSDDSDTSDSDDSDSEVRYYHCC